MLKLDSRALTILAFCIISLYLLENMFVESALILISGMLLSFREFNMGYLTARGFPS